MRLDLFIILFVSAQVIGEAFPISSSGHLFLAVGLLNFFGIKQISILPNFFDHWLHGFSMVVIATFFFKEWFVGFRFVFRALLQWISGGFSWVSLSDSHKRMLKLFGYIVYLTFLADVVTVICYGLFAVAAKKFLFFHGPVIVLGGFLMTVCLLLSLKLLARQKSSGVQLSPLHALILGLVQGLSLLPGISRFASTFVCARWLGISSERALQFSFLMLFPLISAAFFINGLPSMINYPNCAELFSLSWILMYFVVTLFSYCFFSLACRMALKETFWKFGVYMMFPIVILVYLIRW